MYIYIYNPMKTFLHAYTYIHTHTAKLQECGLLIIMRTNKYIIDKCYLFNHRNSSIHYL